MRSVVIVGVLLAGCAGVEELGSHTSGLACLDEIHVDPTAQPGGDGSEQTPFQTIGQAEQCAERKTLVLHGGVYPETIFGPDKWSGTSAARVTVRAYNSEPVIFDPGDHCFKLPTPACIQAPWTACVESSHEACAGAHPDEYISSADKQADMKWGTLLSLDTRLLSYSRLEDLRALNQSDVIVPLSDPRPGFPVDGDQPLKRVYTYRGPGLFYDAAHQRIHVRLSHTILGAGVINYTGSTNPNLVPMSIANELTVAARNNASHINFQNIVFQNGGDVTFESNTTDVDFVGCTFRGGREVVRLGSANNYKFTDCQFTAMLGSWVSRDDVKDQYRGPPKDAGTVACEGLNEHDACTFTCDEPNLCNIPSGSCSMPGTCTYRLDEQALEPPLIQRLTCVNADPKKPCHAALIGTCRQTATMLVATNHTVANLEIANSEFRDGHDAIQAWGTNTNIHHSLFENINDDVFFTDLFDVHNVQIHHNVIRKALHVFDHDAQATATNGARYYYRNIIDNRVPTLGSHRLAADGKPIWQFGTDFKLNNAPGAFYAYHNTIVQANPAPPVLSYSMSDTPVSQPRTRRWFNNIHVTFDGNRPFGYIPDAAYMAQSKHNVWSRRRTVVGSVTKYFGIADAEVPEGWDEGSVFEHPRFENVPDYGLPHGTAFENTDYRLDPSLNSMCSAGIVIPEEWPDESYLANPTVGAIPCNGASFKVGVNQRFEFPIADRPVAEAGDYSTITDSDGDGFEMVLLDASQSTSSTSFTWRYGFGGPLLGTSAFTGTAVPTGTHQYFLSVTDASSNLATDMREITVIDPLPHSDLVRDPSFETGGTGWTLGTGVSVVTSSAHFLERALQMTGSPTVQRQASQIVPIISGGAVAVSAWLKTSAFPSPLARIRIEWLDAGGGLLEIQPVETVTSLSYQYCGGTFTAPAGAVAAKVKLLLDVGTASGFFDDVRVRIPDNKVANPHFEEGPAGWSPIGLAAPTISTVATNVRSLISAAEIANDGATGRRFRQVVPNIIGGQPYTVSGWIKSNLSGGQARIEIVWLDEVGAPLGGPNIIGTSPPSVSPYTEVSEAPQSHPDARAVRIELVVPASASGTAWFDDINVRGP